MKRKECILPEFQKYDVLGAYHWEEIGRNLKKHNPFTAERYRWIKIKLKGLEAGSRVIDYGCGDGALLGMLARRFPEYVLSGLEPSKTGLRLATEQLQKHQMRVELYDSCQKLAESSYKAVICSEVIEHVEDPVKLLRQLHRIAEPNGIVILTTPIRITEKPMDNEHVKEFFVEELVELCTATGLFKLKEIKKIIPAGSWDAYNYGIHPFAPQKMVNTWMKIRSAWFDKMSFNNLFPRSDYYCTQLLILNPIK